ncbi:MAG TPA: polysaccharide deacetylase family protein, partial [Thermoanaerobaculia bacterium]|nr:polysaccharide deacetylase family protein [Thermoanaerobaculia bacterium]
MIPGTAAISSDIDTLASIYKGRGCRRPGGYSFAELRIGLENFSRFLARYDAKATLFMVGSDFLIETNHAPIRAAAAEGHEIANHSMNHVQGFRMLSVAEKEAEIAGMEDVCKSTIGVAPVGFRSPGWNIADDVLPILKRRGYR